jgi:Fanconi anemia group M protein
MFVKHRWINPGSMEERIYQKRVLETALTGNTLCVLPTGLGKTPLAALVAAYRLEELPAGKVLVLAPTRPLVDQHRKSFEKFLKIGTDELVTVTGRVAPEARTGLYEIADVVFSTPQTIRNDLKNGGINLKDFILLIVDEAHRAVKKYSYTFIAEQYMRHAKDPLILALTASPGGRLRRIQEVKEKLFIKNIEIRTSEDEDVKPYIQDTEIHRIEVELGGELLRIKSYLEKLKENRIEQLHKWGFVRTGVLTKAMILELQKKLVKDMGGPSFTALSYLAEILKIDHALILAETQCLYTLEKYMKKLLEQGAKEETKAAIRLTTDGNFRKAMKLLKKTKQEHPKVSELKRLVGGRLIIFTQYRDTVAFLTQELKKIKGCKPVALIGQGKQGLKQKEQIQLIREYELGFHNTLITTSIGEEGLHLGSAETAVFYEPIPSAIRAIQRRGRVGREQFGRIYIMITKNTRDEAYYWSAYHKERKMETILRRMQTKSLRDF